MLERQVALRGFFFYVAPFPFPHTPANLSVTCGQTGGARDRNKCSARAGPWVGGGVVGGQDGGRGMELFLIGSVKTHWVNVVPLLGRAAACDLRGDRWFGSPELLLMTMMMTVKH